jgi:hypothetical protein
MTIIIVFGILALGLCVSAAIMAVLGKDNNEIEE